MLPRFAATIYSVSVKGKCRSRVVCLPKSGVSIRWRESQVRPSLTHLECHPPPHAGTRSELSPAIHLFLTLNSLNFGPQLLLSHAILHLQLATL